MGICALMTILVGWANGAGVHSGAQTDLTTGPDDLRWHVEWSSDLVEWAEQSSVHHALMRRLPSRGRPEPKPAQPDPAGHVQRRVPLNIRQRFEQHWLSEEHAFSSGMM